MVEAATGGGRGKALHAQWVHLGGIKVDAVVSLCFFGVVCDEQSPEEARGEGEDRTWATRHKRHVQPAGK